MFVISQLLLNSHPRSTGRGGDDQSLHHNFIVIAPMIMKLRTDTKLDALYTMITKSLLLRNYDAITRTLADT